MQGTHNSKTGAVQFKSTNSREKTLTDRAVCADMSACESTASRGRTSERQWRGGGRGLWTDRKSQIYLDLKKLATSGEPTHLIVLPSVEDYFF